MKTLVIGKTRKVNVKYFCTFKIRLLHNICVKENEICHSPLLLAIMATVWNVLHIIAKHMLQNPTNTGCGFDLVWRSDCFVIPYRQKSHKKCNGTAKQLLHEFIHQTQICNTPWDLTMIWWDFSIYKVPLQH